MESTTGEFFINSCTLALQRTVVRMWARLKKKNNNKITVRVFPPTCWWAEVRAASAAAHSSVVELSCSVLPSIGRDVQFKCVAITCFGTGCVGQSGNLHTESLDGELSIHPLYRLSHSSACLFTLGIMFVCGANVAEVYFSISMWVNHTIHYSFSIFIYAYWVKIY